MKKIISFTALVLFAISTLTAQTFNDSDKYKTTFGIKAGLDNTKVFNAGNYLSKYNFYAGFFAETRFSLKSSLQYELRYVSYGNDHFIETPILFKYRIAKRLSLYGGPRLDFSLENEEPAENFSVALEVGMQYDINKHFFIDASYSFSFQNQINTDVFDTGSRRNIRFGLGYKF